MSIRVFKTFDDELKCLWLELESRTDPYIFQRYLWLSHWQDTIGNDSPRTEPSIVLLEDSDGPQALIPFCLKKRMGVKILSFIGGNQSDYHCPIMSVQGKDELRRPESWEIIFNNLPDYDVLHIDKIPETCILDGVMPWQNTRCVFFKYAYAAEIPSNWEDFSKRLRSRLKSDSRRQQKRLSKQGELKFENFDLDSEKSKSVMEIFFKQKRSRFQETGVRDTLANFSSRRFYSDMSRKLGEGVSIRFSILWLNDTILATHWGIVDKECFYFLIPTFSSEWKSYSPGRLLLEHLFRWSIEQRLKVFDFTIGDEEYKKEWCNRETKLFELLQIRTVKGRVYEKLLNAKRVLNQSPTIMKSTRKARRLWYLKKS